MTSYKDLFIAQIGTETTFASDAAPTAKLMGVTDLTITPMQETEQVKTLDGRLAPSSTLLRTKQHAEASLTSLLLYEDVCYWLDGAFGEAATSDNAAYTTNADGIVQRVYKAPLATFATDLAAVPSYTVLYGDVATASDCFNIQGAIVNSITIKGESGAPGELSVDLIGAKSLADAIDATKVDRDVVAVMGNHWSLWIDPDTDTIGTTAITDIAFSFELQLNCNRAMLWHLGDLSPDSYRNAEWDGTLNLTLQLGSDAMGYMAALVGNTPQSKVVRLKGTTGTTTALRTLQIDFNGAVLEVPTMFSDADGVVTVEMTLQGKYGATLANWLVITNQNAITAMP